MAPSANPRLRALRIDELRCSTDGQRADQQDLNHDGTADLVSLYGDSTSMLSCRQADFNFDGRLDAYFHYDPKGSLEREQFDLDYDGRIDIGRTFKNGKLVLDEQDTDRDGFVDSWRRYDKGRLLRIETDRDRDGRADMFTYYVAGRIDRIGYDVDGDGRVDEWDHDAARRAREAKAVRKQKATDAARGGGSSDAYVDEADTTDAASEQPKSPTSAPERTGRTSLRPTAGVSDNDPAGPANAKKPETTEPETTEPETTEPETAEPRTAEPQPAEPQPAETRAG